MGYLHQGHISLVREAQHHSDLIVVSIYVNPGQFSPTEDLSTYPSNFRAYGNSWGVDVVFHPHNLYHYGPTNESVDSDGDKGLDRKGTGVVSCVEDSGFGHETWVRVENLEKVDLIMWKEISSSVFTIRIKLKSNSYFGMEPKQLDIFIDTSKLLLFLSKVCNPIVTHLAILLPQQSSYLKTKTWLLPFNVGLDYLCRTLHLNISCSFHPICLTLWGALVQDISEKLSEVTGNNPIIMGTKMIVQTKRGLSLSSRESSTIKINPNNYEATTLHQWYDS
ncbi:hypothetical protein G4B88_028039 [Cannabis sativa]|uniref:Pantoate--beta-alanine ligase n=1 Tax=Cannabis sativa TaxID=3483 RepID=A0A7J6DSG2_CANSA|nr:hypothetical protein G4B88_028039 [Cannabis sativa]